MAKDEISESLELIPIIEEWNPESTEVKLSWADEMDKIDEEERLNKLKNPPVLEEITPAPDTNAEEKYYESQHNSYSYKKENPRIRPQYERKSSGIKLVPFPINPPYVAYVCNLHPDTTKEEITQFFDGCKVKNIKIIYNRETSEPRGFCYVEFEDSESLKLSLEFDSKALKKRSLKIVVAEADKKKDASSRKNSFDEGSYFKSNKANSNQYLSKNKSEKSFNKRREESTSEDKKESNKPITTQVEQSDSNKGRAAPNQMPSFKSHSFDFKPKRNDSADFKTVGNSRNYNEKYNFHKSTSNGNFKKKESVAYVAKKVDIPQTTNFIGKRTSSEEAKYQASQTVVTNIFSALQEEAD